MSAAIDALNSGFSALLATNGEPLTLTRGDASTVQMTAIVNRLPGDDKPDRPEFTPRDVSEIRTRIGAVLPKVGEYFTDAYGLVHRIRSLQRLGEFVTFHCKTSSTP